MTDDSSILADMCRWVERLVALAEACACAYPAEAQARLLDIYGLLHEAPAASALAGTYLPDRKHFADLLAVDAMDSAALLLLGADCGYMLSRGITGRHIASVLLPGRDLESSASADSLALALVGAIALALGDLTIFQHGGDDFGPMPSSRLN